MDDLANLSLLCRIDIKHNDVEIVIRLFCFRILLTDFYIGWWNVENLFDIQDSPRREKRIESKIKSDVNGWTSDILDTKISQLSKIIKKMNEGKGPDILGVCEIENEHVLKKLAEGISESSDNYKIAHADTGDGRGIDIAFLYDDSKFELKETFQHWVIKRTATRELFQANMKVREDNSDLILIGNHWPARSAGTYISEPYRMLTGETLSYWMSRILEEKGKKVPVLVMGDFNDEPFNRSIIEYALGTNIAEKVKNSTTAPRLYNLMWSSLKDGLATYYFKGNWTMLDQFMVSKGFLVEDGSLKLKSDSTTVEKFPDMIKNGKPHRFGLPKKTLNLDGYSDHFPISTVISTKN